MTVAPGAALGPYAIRAQLGRCGPPASHARWRRRGRVPDGRDDVLGVHAFTTLVVRTDTSIYRITILRPHVREVLVQGGKGEVRRGRVSTHKATKS